MKRVLGIAVVSLALFGLWWFWAARSGGEAAEPVSPGVSEARSAGEAESPVEPAMTPPVAVRSAVEVRPHGRIVAKDRRDVPLEHGGTLELRFFYESGGEGMPSEATVDIDEGLWRGPEIPVEYTARVVRVQLDGLAVLGLEPPIFFSRDVPVDIAVDIGDGLWMTVLDAATGHPVPRASVWTREYRGSLAQLFADSTAWTRFVRRPGGAQGDLPVAERADSPISVVRLPEQARWVVTAPGYASKLVAPPAPEATQVEVRLEPAARLWLDGSGLDASAQVRIHYPAFGAVRTEESDASLLLGKTIEPGLGPVGFDLDEGTHGIAWRLEGASHWRNETIELQRDRDAVLVLDWDEEAPAPAHLRGELRIDGPIRARPNLTISSGPPHFHRVQAVPEPTDSDGLWTFECSLPAPGHYRLSVNPPGVSFHREFQVGENTATLHVPRGAPRRVWMLDASNGSPIDPAQMGVSLLIDPPNENSGGVGRVLRGEAGAVEFEAPVGRLAYHILAEGYGVHTGSLELVEGQTDYSVTLEPLCLIEVHLRRGDVVLDIPSEWTDAIVLLDSSGQPIPVRTNYRQSTPGASAGPYMQEVGKSTPRPMGMRAILGVDAVHTQAIAHAPDLPGMGSFAPVTLELRPKERALLVFELD